MIRVLLAAFALPLALFLTGCASGNPAPTPGPTAADPAPAGGVAPQALPDGYGSTAADGAFPRDVVHFGGTTTIPAEPQRVVVISTGQLDGVLSLGLTPVGAAEAAGSGLVPSYLNGAFPTADLTSIQSVGPRAEPDLEAIAALRPDLLLVSTVGAEKIGPALGDIAPLVVTEGTGVNWQQDLLLIAAALGRTGQAEDLLRGLLDEAAQVGAGFGDETVSVVRFSGDRIRIFGTGSFVGSLLAAGDVARPDDQQFEKTSQDLSPEELRQADGDRLFYGVQDEAANADALKSPLWTGLPAVADGTAVKVDDDAWFLNAGPAAAKVVLTQLSQAA